MLQKDNVGNARMILGSFLQRWWGASMPSSTDVEASTVQNSVRENIYENASLSVPFIIMNILATIVASYGLLANSTAVVIGAMVIATLLGPIMGIALGLLESHPRLLRKAVLSEVFGVVLVLGVSFLIGCFYQKIPSGSELLSRTSPNTFDLVIALAGGAAGAYAMVSPRLSVGLVGVAVATALVPPLSTCGIFLARGNFDQAGGAFILFITNLVAIQFSSSVVFLLTGYAGFTKQPMRWRAFLVRNGVSLALLILLAVVLGLNLETVVDRTLDETQIRADLTKALEIYPEAYLTDVRIDNNGTRTLVTAVVRTPVAFTPTQVGHIETQLRHQRNSLLVLHIRSVITIETTQQGTLSPTFPALP